MSTFHSKLTKFMTGISTLRVFTMMSMLDKMALSSRSSLCRCVLLFEEFVVDIVHNGHD